jgi:hypothetical protein
MTKRSAFERARRAAHNARVAETEGAWRASLPNDVAADFDARVRAARERGPLPRPPDMAPGTPPRPPRPGREPKPPTDERARRGRGR